MSYAFPVRPLFPPHLRIVIEGIDFTAAKETFLKVNNENRKEGEREKCPLKGEMKKNILSPNKQKSFASDLKGPDKNLRRTYWTLVPYCYWFIKAIHIPPFYQFRVLRQHTTLLTKQPISNTKSNKGGKTGYPRPSITALSQVIMEPTQKLLESQETLLQKHVQNPSGMQSIFSAPSIS